MQLPNQPAWSRRQFVLTLANKEGGAHVDPNLNEDYERLCRRNGLGWTYSDDANQESAFLGSPIAASVRQIAHETLTTLNDNKSLLT